MTPETTFVFSFAQFLISMTVCLSSSFSFYFNRPLSLRGTGSCMSSAVSWFFFFLTPALQSSAALQSTANFFIKSPIILFGAIFFRFMLHPRTIPPKDAFKTNEAVFLMALLHVVQITLCASCLLGSSVILIYH